ncbi:Gag polyprotein [Lucilia cuprina]|nr:Gag polyprotein [Lucilia cuprina]
MASLLAKITMGSRRNCTTIGDSGFELGPHRMSTNNNNNNKESNDDSKSEEMVIPVDENKNTTDAITKLGMLISSLMKFVKPKNNVHLYIKEQLRVMRVTYDMALEEINVGETETARQMEQASQTSPKLTKVFVEAKKRSRDSSDESPKTKPKKMKKRSTNSVEKTEDATRKENVGDTAPTSNWLTVTRKKSKQSKKSRPTAMIISANGENTYADILRKIKADPNLQNFGENVRRVRRTQKGELLLEINSYNKDETVEFNELVGKSLAGSAEIKTKISETLIECKDLDEVTTKEDICTALKNQLNAPALEESVVKHIRKAYGGTQIAKISLPDEVAQKALKLGKLKIGWSVCRVRQPIVLKRCFKCLEFGHIANSCKSSFDRSKLCRKCGEENHIAKDCTSEAKYMNNYPLCEIQLCFASPTH